MSEKSEKREKVEKPQKMHKSCGDSGILIFVFQTPYNTNFLPQYHVSSFEFLSQFVSRAVFVDLLLFISHFIQRRKAV